MISVQENSVKDLHPSDFDENDKMYDAGEYQYCIDDNFEPKQSLGKAQFRDLRVYHPILTNNVPSFLVKIPISDVLLRSLFGLIRKYDKLWRSMGQLLWKLVINKP